MKFGNFNLLVLLAAGVAQALPVLELSNTSTDIDKRGVEAVIVVLGKLLPGLFRTGATVAEEFGVALKVVGTDIEIAENSAAIVAQVAPGALDLTAAASTGVETIVETGETAIVVDVDMGSGLVRNKWAVGGPQFSSDANVQIRVAASTTDDDVLSTTISSTQGYISSANGAPTLANNSPFSSTWFNSVEGLPGFFTTPS